MEDTEPVLVNLLSLIGGVPALTSALGGALAEAAAICLADRGHDESCRLQFWWDSEWRNCTIDRLPVSDLMYRAYRDLQEATELGACAIAILLARELTGLVAVERSVKGTGFDYWLGAAHSPDSRMEPFERKARLEVSGILQGEIDLVEARVRDKVRQVRRSSGDYPAYIIVVEFGTPLAWMERDE